MEVSNIIGRLFQRLTDLFKSSLTVAILSLTQVGHFNSFVHCRCLEFVSLKLPFLISVSFQQSRLLNRDCTVHFTERCLNSSRLCLDLFLSNNCSGYSWINIRTRTDRGKISAPFVLLSEPHRVRIMPWQCMGTCGNKQSLWQWNVY